MTESTLTYEALFELVRSEKKKDEIQKLDETVYDDIVRYLHEKIAILKRCKEGGNESEIHKVRTQVMNVRRLIKEFIERRQRKIISLSINKSSTQSDSEAIVNLLPEEQILYALLVRDLNAYRSGVLLNMLNGKTPQLSGTDIGLKRITEKPVMKSEDAVVEKQETTESGMPIPKISSSPHTSSVNDAPSGTKVRLLRDVPKFAGLGGEVYGPYSKGDTPALPDMLANALVKNGRAENI